MASLLDMRRRIKSVKNTQQITKALKMVAAAKLKRSQDKVVAARPYAEQMSDVLGGISAKVADEFSHPLLDERGDEKYLIVLISGDKGLAGAVNTNVIKATQNFLNENSGKESSLVAVGRKGRDFFKRRKVEMREEYIGIMGGQVKHSDAADVAARLIADFTEDTSIDKVFVVFTEFKSVLSQSPVIRQLLPIPRVTAEEEGAETGPNAEYIYEQPAAEIFGRLLPKQVETQLYRGMLESSASFFGSQMTAMDSASKNAGELIDTLTLNMNRIRQAAITKEIIEVVSGAAAA
ncbi:MAG: ATP synthase F1 subunit gamma [Acidobacteria bacterium OLB17]|nr:MAG: ATP synthase F1 subunit gamma [Acidobacteria bacterium OLB17]MCZ2390900.1 ATP synthase F1 subunit gamma [Acidobacteriota bacterium]